MNCLYIFQLVCTVSCPRIGFWICAQHFRSEQIPLAYSTYRSQVLSPWLGDKVNPWHRVVHGKCVRVDSGVDMGWSNSQLRHKVPYTMLFFFGFSRCTHMQVGRHRKYKGNEYRRKQQGLSSHSALISLANSLLSYPTWFHGRLIFLSCCDWTLIKSYYISRNVLLDLGGNGTDFVLYLLSRQPLEKWKITFSAPLFCKVTDVHLKPSQFM